MRASSWADSSLKRPVRVPAVPLPSPAISQPRPARRRPSLSSKVIHFDDPCRVERRRVEAFIEDAYARAYGSRIGAHYPTLMSVQDESGKIYAVVGFRLAGAEPLFLEQYLDVGIETALSDAQTTPVARSEIVEIGNLASNGRGATIFLFADLSKHLRRLGATFAVATATAELRGIFQRAGLQAFSLTAADPARLADHGADWGDYYRADPVVLAGSIASAFEPLDRMVGATPLGHAVSTRLHFRGACS